MVGGVDGNDGDDFDKLILIRGLRMMRAALSDDREVDEANCEKSI